MQWRKSYLALRVTIVYKKQNLPKACLFKLKVVNCDMFSKWRIKGFDNYVFGDDNKLYRLPYTKDKRSYSIREIKKQYPSRYRINNEWYSERQFKPLIYLDPEPIELFKIKDFPF